LPDAGPYRAGIRSARQRPDPDSGPGPVSLIGPGPGFDAAYAMTTDLDDPVIIASITVPGEPPGPAGAAGSG
jgi:hypothetical protein